MERPPEPSAADLYARLGIAPNASSSQISSAYRHLALALHPDSASTEGGNPAHLRLVIEAHRILSDPQLRQRYDSTTNRPRQLASRSGPVCAGTCAVCRGAGAIVRCCHLCTGAGHVLANSPWLRAPRACPVCDARGYDLARCGACGGTGRTFTT
jgi:DnaJ-class molecular chaperone